MDHGSCPLSFHNSDYKKLFGGDEKAYNNAKDELQRCLCDEFSQTKPNRCEEQFITSILPSIQNHIRKHLLPPFLEHLKKNSADDSRRSSTGGQANVQSKPMILKPGDFWNLLRIRLPGFTFKLVSNIAMGTIPATMEKKHPNFAEDFERAAAKEVDAFLDAVVRTRRANYINGVAGGARKTNNLLWRIFVAKGRTNDEADIPKVRNTIKIFLAAATATISEALTTFFKLLVSHQECHDWIAEKVAGMEGWRNGDLLQELGFLRACVCETLRLSLVHPSVDLEKLAQQSCGKEGSSKTMQEQMDKFIPGRWVDRLGFVVGPEKEREGEEYKLCCMNDLVCTVMMCVAVDMLSRFMIREERRDKDNECGRS